MNALDMVLIWLIYFHIILFIGTSKISFYLLSISH